MILSRERERNLPPFPFPCRAVKHTSLRQRGGVRSGDHLDAGVYVGGVGVVIRVERGEE